MDLGAIRKALADAVATNELKSYAYVPESPATPCAVVGAPEQIEYHQAMGRDSLTKITLPMTLVLGRMNSVRAQEQLDDFLSLDNENSVLKRVEQDTTLGGLVHALQVTGARSFYATDTKHIGMDFEIEVWA